MLFSSITFFVVAIASLALAVDTDVDPGLVANLRTADTNLDKMNLLSKDSDWFFDFCKSDNYNFSPGGVAWANAATFPATVGNGMSMVSSLSLSLTSANISRPSSTLVLAPCSHLMSTLEPQNTPSLWQAQPKPS